MNTVMAEYKWVLLALTIWREARGCTNDEKTAVAHVVANRAASPNSRQYGGPTLVGVLTAPDQFTSISPPHNAVTSLPEWFNATSWPAEGDTIWAECCAIADAIGSGADGADPTGGATNYYTEPIAQVPTWADPAKLTLSLGPFRFYKL